MDSTWRRRWWLLIIFRFSIENISLYWDLQIIPAPFHDLGVKNVELYMRLEKTNLMFLHRSYSTLCVTGYSQGEKFSCLNVQVMYVHTNKNSSSWCTSKMTVMWSVHLCLSYIIKWNRDFSMSLKQRHEWENKNKWQQKYC